jgi:alpha-tubulin suppressor-like RCC1 family protein
VAGKTTSEPATLTVQAKPAMTKQPASITRDAGESASFEATASGFPAPTVQWELSTDGGATFSPIVGATSNTLTIESTSISEDGSEFRAVFTNAAGAVTSAAATLTVHAPPVVTQEPASTIVETGETAVFEASASGYPTPTVQWQVSTNAGSTWVALTGATSNQLTIENAQVAENGHQFRALFTNAAGAATSHAAILTVATTKYNAVAWGSNALRQLGDGSANFLSDVPVSVSGLKFVTAVAAGGAHSLALLANGAVMAWGSDEVGQLGNGQNETLSSVPIAVEGVSEAVAVAAGESHSLALLKNGKVMAWGNNESGQLGTGSGAFESTVPVEVKGLTNVKAIAAGANHSLALLANGTVMAWGDNESGQLGNGNTTLSRVPVAVKGGLSGVTGISAGGKFSLALLSKGTVEGWGSDESGQLANASVEEGVSKLPVPVGSLTGVVAVAAGATHGLALTGSGTVMAWGSDSFGELGNGTIKPTEETPVAVSGLSGVTAIAAGGDDSLALLGSGSAMTWGTNQRGTLGNGTTGSPSAVPVLVSSLRKVASISAGLAHMLAFGEPVPAVTSVSPKVGPSTGGTTVTISGGDLSGATKVTFGANEATSFTVESSTSITATAPPGSGTVDVVVTTPAGISATGPADRYTYQLPPTVTKLLPKSGPTTGGTSVVITGTGFTAASAVSFGALGATAYTVNSSTSITAVAPAQAAGTFDVRVSNTAGQSAISSADRFKYTPVIESVTPNSGSVSGSTSVEVTGTGFAPGSTATTFKFGNAKATAVNCTSSTICTMKAPAHEAGTVHVVATVAKVLSPASVNNLFTYS